MDQGSQPWNPRVWLEGLVGLSFKSTKPLKGDTSFRGDTNSGGHGARKVVTQMSGGAALRVRQRESTAMSVHPVRSDSQNPSRIPGTRHSL